MYSRDTWGRSGLATVVVCEQKIEYTCEGMLLFMERQMGVCAGGASLDSSEEEAFDEGLDRVNDMKLRLHL